MTSSRLYHVLLAQDLGISNTRAQAHNARSLLEAFPERGIQWHVPHVSELPLSLCAREHIKPVEVLSVDALAALPGRDDLPVFDAIFYPGNKHHDRDCIERARRVNSKLKVISTIESPMGDPARERLLQGTLSPYFRCFAHPLGSEYLANFDYVHRNSDLIIAISDRLADYARAIFPSKCIVLDLGVDTTLFSSEERQPRLHTPTRILAVGRCAAEKRPLLFLELAKRHRALQFTWVGNGPLAPQLDDLAAGQKTPNFQYLAAMPQQELATVYRSADLLLLLSLAEGVPKVAQEAIACGTPAAVFANYRTPTVINGENGYTLFSDGNLHALLDALACDPRPLAALQAACRAKWYSRPWQQVARSWHSAIEQVLITA